MAKSDSPPAQVGPSRAKDAKDAKDAMDAMDASLLEFSAGARAKLPSTPGRPLTHPPASEG